MRLSELAKLISVCLTGRKVTWLACVENILVERLVSKIYQPNVTMVNSMKPLIRRTFCPNCGTPFGFARQLRFHIRNCVSVNYHSKFKYNYCPMNFHKKNRVFHAHEDECKMYADSTKIKLKDETRKNSQIQNQSRQVRHRP